MESIINFLPQFILYIVLGFVFLRVFNYCCAIKNSEGYENIIWGSIIVGFVLSNFFSLFPTTHYQIVDILGMVISTAFLAFLFSKIYASKTIDRCLRYFGVYRTKHNYIWQDIIDDNGATYISAYNPETHEMYCGYLKFCEDYEKHPQIILQYYKYYVNCFVTNDEKIDGGQLAYDCSDDPSYVIMIDTEKFCEISATYNSDSEKTINKDDKSLKKDCKAIADNVRKNN